MPGGIVDRTLLASFYQNAGDVYDDTKTEGAFDVVADQVDANWGDYDTHKTAAVLDHPDGSVTSAKLADSAVVAGKISDSAVITAKLNDAAVTLAKMAAASVGSAQLVDLSVITAKLNDLAVTTGKMADAAVTTAKIADLNVSSGKLANAAVTTSKISDAAITTAKIANAAVGVAQLSPGAQVNESVNNALITALSADVKQRGINPKSSPYNAIGDGVTDDTTSIQMAIDAAHTAGGGIVYFPKGTYITGALTGYDGVSVLGAGQTVTILKAKSTLGSSYLLTMGKNAYIAELTLDGNATSRGISDDTNASVLTGIGATDLVIRHVEIKNATGAGIFLYSASRVFLEMNYIHDGESNGILASHGCSTIRVMNNIIENSANQNGIFFMFDGLSCSDVVIEGNRVKTSADFGIEVGDHVTEGSTPHQYVHVRNNYIEASTNAGIAFRSVSYGTIEGNTIIGWGSDGYGCNGIFVEGENQLCQTVFVKNNNLTQNSSGTADGIYVTGMDDVVVEANTVDGSLGKGIIAIASSFTGTTTDFPDGKRLVHNIRFANNKVVNSASDGIFIQAYAGDNFEVIDNVSESNMGGGVVVANLSWGRILLIRGNILKRNHGSGVYVQSQSHTVISGNIIEENNYTLTSGAAIYLITSDATIDNNQIIDNQATPSQTERYHFNNSFEIYATNSKVAGAATTIGIEPSTGNSGVEVSLPNIGTGVITITTISGTTQTTKTITPS